MRKTLNIFLVILIVLSSFNSFVPVSAGGYDIKFEVVSTSPIGVTVRTTIDGSPKDVQMVVLNLDDIRNGVPPEKARQQEIKYSEVNKITTETVEQKTPIMGKRDITIDDVLAKVSAPIEEESKEPVYSKPLITYLESVKVANTTTSKVGGVDTAKLSTAVSSKTELTKTLVDKTLQPEIDKVMADMPETVSDVVDYDVKQVEQEVKTEIMTSKVTSESKIFDVSEPMVLEATVTSGGWESKDGWGASGVVALLIDGQYYYDMSHSSWYSTAYAHRLQFTISTANIDADVSNFPVKLWLSTSSGTGNTDLTAFFNAISYANRLKIAVTDSTSTTQCKVEIVSGSTEWTNKTVEMYVNVPTLSHTSSTSYYLYYDSTQADNTAYVGDTTSTPAKAVWDANYVGVYHMNDGIDTSHIYDSTSNGNNGTKTGAGTPGVTTGQKGYAQNNTSTKNITTTDAAVQDVTSALTMESWFNVSGTGLGNQSLFLHDSSAYKYMLRCMTNFSNPTFYVTTTSGLKTAGITKASNYYSDGNWHYMVGRYDRSLSAASRLKIWTDIDTNTGTGYDEDILAGDQGLEIFSWNSGTYLVGNLQEIRVSNIARKDEWIKATYYSEKDALISWGSEQSISVPSVTTIAASSITATTATLNENVTSAGNGDLTVHGFQWDTDSGAPYANDWNEAGTSTGAYTHDLSSLTGGTTYYFRAYATNQAGTGYGSELSFTTLSANPNPPTYFLATASGNNIVLSFTKGSGATNTVILRGDNRYPTSITDGTIVDNTTGTSVTDTNQNSEIATKYYSAWSLDNSTGSYSLSYATTQGGATVMLMAVIVALIALVIGIFIFARG